LLFVHMSNHKVYKSNNSNSGPIGLSAGYVYAPYIPLEVTPTFMLDELPPVQRWLLQVVCSISRDKRKRQPQTMLNRIELKILSVLDRLIR